MGVLVHVKWFVPCLLFIFVAPPTAGGNGRETPVVLAVRKASPAVVNISAEIPSRQTNPFGGFSPFFDDFFRDFFGDLPERRRQERSLGSGVVIRPDGTILTNEHVIANASRILVTRASGEEYEARVVGADARTDLAVLMVDTEQELPYIEMGRSLDLMIGETVIAIGNPFGLSHTVTTGVVSALNRTIRGGNDQIYTDFIQTDASINPGNSGGPLLNIEGALIGINSAIYQRAEGIGFAIPIDKARRIVEDLIAYGEVHRAWLGLHVQDLTPELARHFKTSQAMGVIVTRVFDGSPAAKAGIRRSDLLLAMDGLPLQSQGDFLERLAGYTAGDVLEFQVARKGEVDNLKVEALEVPDEYLESLGKEWLGIEVKENSRALALRHGLATTKGLVVADVRSGSAAARAGLEPGDVVRQVNGVAVDTAKDYRDTLLVASQRETVVLVVQRGRVAYYVSLSP